MRVIVEDHTTPATTLTERQTAVIAEFMAQLAILMEEHDPTAARCVVEITLDSGLVISATLVRPGHE